MDVRKLKKCAVCEKMLCTRKFPVPPAGNAKPKVVVVGQAPGREEDRAGEPFVGSAGELFKALLEIIADIDLADVYFTNAVKCYPGKAKDGDRKPSKEEIGNCASRWLHKELETLQPKFVLVLGQVALDAVAESTKLKEVHGQVLKKQVLKNKLDVKFRGRIMPINHPSVRNATQALKFVKGLVAFCEVAEREEESSI